MLIHIICARCGKLTEKERGAVNRAHNTGLNIYCDRRCAGLGRRKPPKRKKQRVKEKRLYDIEYRRKNHAILKEKKRLQHLRTYDPVEAARVRKLNMKRHVEYCRQPEYKRKKKDYDRRRRASEFGQFAEAYLLFLDLNKSIKERITNHEIRKENDTLNKIQERRRQDGANTGRGRDGADTSRRRYKAADRQ